MQGSRAESRSLNRGAASRVVGRSVSWGSCCPRARVSELAEGLHAGREGESCGCREVGQSREGHRRGVGGGDTDLAGEGEGDQQEAEGRRGEGPCHPGPGSGHVRAAALALRSSSLGRLSSAPRAGRRLRRPGDPRWDRASARVAQSSAKYTRRSSAVRTRELGARSLAGGARSGGRLVARAREPTTDARVEVTRDPATRSSAGRRLLVGRHARPLHGLSCF
jgi:hypothetical protein